VSRWLRRGEPEPDAQHFYDRYYGRPEPPAPEPPPRRSEDLTGARCRAEVERLRAALHQAEAAATSNRAAAAENGVLEQTLGMAVMRVERLELEALEMRRIIGALLFHGCGGRFLLREEDARADYTIIRGPRDPANLSEWWRAEPRPPAKDRQNDR
jgi:hypothetical protein